MNKLNYFYDLFFGIFVFLYFELKKIKKIYNYIFGFFLNDISIIALLKSGFKINKNSFKDKFLVKFLKLNSKLNNLNSKKIKKQKKQIIVESLINHPIYTLGQCVIANTLMRKKNYYVTGVLRKGDLKSREIMKSFGIKNFEVIDESNIILRLIYFYKSIFILSKIKNLKDFLNFKIDNIEIGKATYEHYGRFVGLYPDKINWKIISFFSESLRYMTNSKKILINVKPRYWIQSEIQFLPHRIIFQQALKFKTKILSRSEIKKVGIKIYKSYHERNINRIKIPYKLFNQLNQKYKNKILKKVNKIFFRNKKNNQIGKEIHQIIDKKFYKKNFKSKKELKDYFNFKNSYPIALILSHEMTDGNFGNRWNLFENDGEWLSQTIKIIKKVKNVNFIIKPHPSEKFYNAKITTQKIFNDLISNDELNIKLFPDEYDVSSIIDYINLSITSHGSAGYQYPAESIPTVICGETPYSGLGFNIEPKSVNKYKRVLNKIPFIKKLNKTKTDKAKLFWYIFFEVTRIEMPLIYYSNIRMDYNRKIFWKKTLIEFSNLNKYKNKFEKCLIHQFEKNNSNLLNLYLLKGSEKLLF